MTGLAAMAAATSREAAMRSDSERRLATLDNPFWDFSLSTYGRPGVAEACLALQDRLGLDVNLLLFCCWAGGCDHRLTEDELERLLAVADPWQERVVAPLRAARRGLAPAGSGSEPEKAFRGRLKALELEAERLLQDRLHQALPLEPAAGAPPPQAMAANLRRYLARRDVTCDVLALADLTALMVGCRADLPPLEAMRQLS